jgi:hypothetical protein
MHQLFQFSIEINAPVSQVYDYMLGLTHKETYTAWTTVFHPTCSYRGNWETGSKINFTSEAEPGNFGGTVTMIQENIPLKSVRMEHIGMLKNDVEVTTGPEVEAWSGCTESFFFESMENDTTSVRVELEMPESMAPYFEKIYPQALQNLKNGCELG